jgi:hypothetical protein
MVAALYVEANGIYASLPDVELWDETRDARTYAGPHPVVAHPPCTRWCALSGLVEARYGYRRGDDGGCFEAALAAVRRFGGVLEHPAYTLAWKAYGLPRPRRGMWRGTPELGYVTHVDQANYGHAARKATWLYAFGITPPALRWDRAEGTRWVSYCGNHGDRVFVPIKHGETRRGDRNFQRRMTKKEANATPTDFRDLLVSIARSVVSSGSGDVK